MLTNREEKLIRSLKQKKYRSKEALFVIEGKKLLEEALLCNREIVYLLSTQEMSEELPPELSPTVVSEDTMKSLSSLTTPSGILAVLKKPDEKPQLSDFILLLDGISDPGNMGTIIRNAEGFGLDEIYCSLDCVDVYSPKVVQSSMGSIFKSRIISCELSEFIDQHQGDYTFYAAEMKGESIYEISWPKPLAIIMGSESHGLSTALTNKEIKKISIPIAGSLESLNVAIANAIILSEFRRKSPL